MLIVDDEVLGQWSPEEIEIRDRGDHSFEIAAEGDSLSFTPADAQSFKSFLALGPRVAEPEIDTGHDPAGPLDRATPTEASAPEIPIPANTAETVEMEEMWETWESTPRGSLGSFVDRIGADPSAERPGDESRTAPPSAKSGGRLAGAIRHRLGGAGHGPDNTESRRQWRLIAGAGAGFILLVCAMIWGGVVLLADDDGFSVDARPVDEPAVPTTSVVTTTTTVAPATTVASNPAANPIAVAGAGPERFVADWNEVVSTYSGGLTVSGSELPIQADLSASIRLTYGTDAVLTIAATPSGSESDQDILAVMGLMVAWAEPSLTPHQRKGVLGAVGIDVDHPQLNEMNGSTVRSGLQYRAAVEGSIVRFSVGPGS